MVSVILHDLSIAELLLKHGADPETVLVNSYRPSDHDWDGPDPSSASRELQSLCGLRVLCPGLLSASRFLWSAGADVDSIVHYAVAKRSVPLAKLLLVYGARENWRDRFSLYVYLRLLARALYI